MPAYAALPLVVSSPQAGTRPGSPIADFALVAAYMTFQALKRVRGQLAEKLSAG